MYSIVLFAYISPISAGIIIILNIIEICFILKTKNSQKKSCDTLILNLAFSDAFVGIDVFLIRIINHINKTVQSEALSVTKDVLTFLLIRISLFASVFSLMAITLLRYYGMNDPFKYHLILNKWTTKICIGIWFLSLVLASAFYCMIRFKVLSIIYHDIVLSICIFIALTGLSILNYYTNNFRKSSRICDTTTVRDLNKTDDTKKSNSEGMKFEDSIKWYVVLSTIGFFISWMPLSVYGIVQVAGYKPYKIFPFDGIGNTVFILAFWNSILNPILYFVTIYRRRSVNKRLKTISEKHRTLTTTTNTVVINSSVD